MLRGQAVDQARSLGQRRDDHRSMVAPRGGRIGARGQGGQLARNLGFDGRGEIGVVGDQDGLRGRVMLGLGQQVGGDPVGPVLIVSDDDDFRRSGQGVDADDAIDPPLGSRHIGVAGADDLVHRRDGPGAVSQRGDGLSPSDPPDLGHARRLGRRQHRRLQSPGGSDHGDAGHAGRRGRDRVHQNGGGIGRPPAGHIDPDRVQRRPTPPHLDPGLVDEAVVGRALTLVIATDPRCGEGDGVSHVHGALSRAGGDLVRRHPKARLRQLHAIEIAGVSQQGRDAFSPHRMENVADDRLHILWRVAARLHQLGEAQVEIGI